MAKKNFIKIEPENKDFVIGIASNEKIWKVVWEVNRRLSANMSAGRPEVTHTQSLELYLDSESNEDFEYCLFENTHKTNKVPKLAREFRFWLVIKPKREKVLETEYIVRELKEVDIISWCADLSNEKNIYTLIP